MSRFFAVEIFFSNATEIIFSYFPAKCQEKCAYMFNVDKNQLSRQTGSRNLMVPKTLPTIRHTYAKLVTKYQISAIDSC